MKSHGNPTAARTTEPATIALPAIRLRSSATYRSNISQFLSVILALAAFFAMSAASASALTRQPFLTSFPASNNGDDLAIDQATGDILQVNLATNAVDKYDSGGTPVNFSALGTSHLDGSNVIAASGAFSFANPNGVAVDSSDGDIYVVDTNHSVVDKFDSAGNYLCQLTGVGGGCTAAGGAATQPFSNSTGVAVGPTGNVYVGDFGHEAVDVFTDTGADVSQFSGMASPGNIAADSLENLYVTPYFARNVLKFGPAGEFVSTLDESGQAVALAVDPATNDIFVDHGTSVIRYDSAGTRIGSAEPGHIGASAGLAFNSSSDPDSADGELFVADSANEAVDIFGPGVPVPPAIEAISAQNVEPGSADLTATVNPNGTDTAFHFSYGPSTAYGTDQPIPAADIGSGETGVPVREHLTGLSPGVLYHYHLVAESTAGTTVGVDHTFVYLHGSSGLPDGRAYELVSPPFKEGARPVLEGVSPDGNRVLLSSLGNFRDANNNQNFGALYIAERGPSGWTSTNIDPPASQFPADTLLDITPNLSTALFSLRASDQSLYNETLWTRSLAGALQELGPILPPEKTQGPSGLGIPQLNATIHYRGSSKNLEKVLLEIIPRGGEDVLWPGDSTSLNGGDAVSLYEYTAGSGGVPTLIGVDNANQLIGQCGVIVGPVGGNHPPLGGISRDGSTVFFTVRGSAQAACPLSQPPVDELYARIDSGLSTAHTLSISAPSVNAKCTTPACLSAPPADALFQAASADGSVVSFTSTGQLTDGAAQDTNPSDSATANSGKGCSRAQGPSGCNLYLYDRANLLGNELIDVSSGSPDPRVQGTVAASDDGSHLYFVAKGDLTGSQQNSSGSTAVDGSNNLYVFERDADFPAGRTAFIATLAPNDARQWLAGGIGLVDTATPDGRYLVFTSVADLTPDDTSAAQQVFRYDAQAGELIRVSVGQKGFNDNGNTTQFNAVLPEPSTGVKGSGLAITDDGAYVVFLSANGLTPQALNGAPTDTPGVFAQNVYSYHQGEVELISDGRDAGSVIEQSSVSFFVNGGITASGSDVFFRTADPLVAQDTDTQQDIYDARVDGGFSQSASPPCLGDGCQPAPSLQPVGPSSGSSTLVGPGNSHPLREQQKRKKKHQHRKTNKPHHPRAANNSRGARR